MILDTFSLVYTADTKRAETAVADLDRRAQKVVSTGSARGTAAVRDMSWQIRETARQATESMRTAQQAADKMHSDFKQKHQVMPMVTGTFAKNINDRIHSFIRTGTAGQAIIAKLNQAYNNSVLNKDRRLALATRWAAGASGIPVAQPNLPQPPVIGKFRPGQPQVAKPQFAQPRSGSGGRTPPGSPPGMPPHNRQTLPTWGKGGGAAGGQAVLSLVGSINGAVGGLLPFIAATTAAAAVMKVFSATMDVATKRAEEAYEHEKRAWEAGMSSQELARMETVGRNLKMTRPMMQEAMKGFADRVKSLAIERATLLPGQLLSREAIAFQRYGTNLFKGGDQNAKTGQIRDLGSIMADVMKRTKGEVASGKISEAHGTERMISLFGFNWDFASRAMKASNEELEKMARTLNYEAAERAGLVAQSKRLADANRELKITQEKVGDKMSQHITPSMTRLTKSFDQFIQTIDPALQGLAKLSAAILDWTSDVLDSASDMFKEASFRWDNHELFMKYQEQLEARRESGEKLPELGSGEYYKILEKMVKADLKTKGVKETGVTTQMQQALTMEDRRMARADTLRVWRNEAKPNTKEDVEAQRIYDEALKMDLTADAMLEQLKAIRKGIGSVVDGQYEGNKDIAEIKLNTAPVLGIEEALGIWAAEVGRAGGLKPAEGFKGTSAKEWIDREFWIRQQKPYTGKTEQQLREELLSKDRYSWEKAEKNQTGRFGSEQSKASTAPKPPVEQNPREKGNQTVRFELDQPKAPIAPEKQSEPTKKEEVDTRLISPSMGVFGKEDVPLPGDFDRRMDKLKRIQQTPNVPSEKIFKKWNDANAQAASVNSLAAGNNRTTNITVNDNSRTEIVAPHGTDAHQLASLVDRNSHAQVENLINRMSDGRVS